MVFQIGCPSTEKIKLFEFAEKSHPQVGSTLGVEDSDSRQVSEKKLPETPQLKEVGS